MGKIFESIIVARIQNKYEEMPSRKQFGFKAELSTEDALIKFRKGIDTEKKYVTALFIDIEGAFDNLWWIGARERLIAAKCCIVNIFASYFRRRKVIVDGKFQTAVRTMQRGCPQGSIFGPAVWNFCMDFLLTRLEQELDDGKVEAIADDLAITIRGGSRTELERLGFRVTDILEEWCVTYKLRVSVEKSCAVMLKGKFDPERHPRFKIGGQSIKYTETVRYLGVIIDKHLNFVAHTKHLREKVLKFVFNIKRVAREEWGLKHNIIEALYNGVILPIVTYGAAAWYDRVDHSHVRRNLSAA